MDHTSLGFLDPKARVTFVKSLKGEEGPDLLERGLPAPDEGLGNHDLREFVIQVDDPLQPDIVVEVMVLALQTTEVVANTQGVPHSTIPEVIGMCELDHPCRGRVSQNSVLASIPHGRASVHDSSTEHIGIQDQSLGVSPRLKSSYLAQANFASFGLGDLFSSPKPCREAWATICLAVIFCLKESKRACKVLSGVSGG